MSYRFFGNLFGGGGYGGYGDPYGYGGGGYGDGFDRSNWRTTSSAAQKREDTAKGELAIVHRFFAFARPPQSTAAAGRGLPRLPIHPMRPWAGCVGVCVCVVIGSNDRPPGASFPNPQANSTAS